MKELSASAGGSHESRPSFSDSWLEVLGPGWKYSLRYSVRGIGQPSSGRYSSAPRTKMVTGGSSMKPVSLSLSQWSYQRSISRRISGEL